MIVEDDPDSAMALSRLLEAEGYDVRCAPDGNSAIKTACSWIPDVIVCDIRLPDRDGCEVMRTMRRACPDLAGVAVSGLTSPEQVARSRGAGFAAHLSKPVDFSVLHGAIRAALRAHLTALSS
jgi:CheY-like chemotaxis protein